MRVTHKVIRKNPASMLKYGNSVAEGIKRQILIGATQVRNDAISSIAQGAKSGRVYRKYNPNRVHKASAAGEAPATDTGFLVSQINLEMDVDRFGASVDSKAPYSSFLEFGTSQMSARPFLQPALEINKKKITANIRRAIKKAGKG